MASPGWPRGILRPALWGYRLLWVLLLPAVLLLLWWRGRRDPLYTAHLRERFGHYRSPLPRGPVWVHGVSLGETRSAVPVVRRLLDRGDRVVMTHFTPAGRRESERVFAADIAAGRLAVVWVPFDTGWCLRRFLRACRPVIGLTMEIEIWPGMVAAARAMGVPLYACNAQYPARSMARDSRGLRLRQRVFAGLAGAMMKSAGQAARFASVGVGDLHVTGELRFDQPVPPALTAAAAAARPRLAQGRAVITFASAVADEEALFRRVMRNLTDAARAEGRAAPLFVLVPRAPERFGAVAADLAAAGLAVIRRSEAFGAGAEGLFHPVPAGPAEVLVGDSLGEMYFYLALADLVVVGGGFTPRGAHNVIEPLALGKAVVTGPQTWTIEYPFEEAAAAGVARSLPDETALVAALAAPAAADPARIAAFLAAHSGAADRTVAAIGLVLGRPGASPGALPCAGPGALARVKASD